ncbi:MAG: hypothetical protein QGH06_01980 [Lutibacter sp.]|nr:hypothetical protein [Lutibacter sp.]
MKRYRWLLFVFIIGILSACQNKERIMEKNISVKLKEQIDNPHGFKFVSMQIEKTFSVAERKEIITEDKLLEVAHLFGESDILNQYRTEFNFLQAQTDESSDAVYYVQCIIEEVNDQGTRTNIYDVTVLNDAHLSVMYIH